MNKTALIVDDEPDAQNLIELLLQEYFKEIEVVKKLSSAEEAYRFLSLKPVDLVFLDIQLGNQTGFQVLERLKGKLKAEVIFVTAHEEFALTAIKASAADYVLKPIDEIDFKEAVDKVLSRLDDSERPIPISNRIALPSLIGLDFVEAKNILFCEADGNYTTVHLVPNDRRTVTKVLAKFEAELAPHGFLRIHHKHLVNLNRIRSYAKGAGGGHVVLDNNMTLSVSARKKQELLNVFG